MGEGFPFVRVSISFRREGAKRSVLRRLWRRPDGKGERGRGRWSSRLVRARALPLLLLLGLGSPGSMGRGMRRARRERLALKGLARRSTLAVRGRVRKGLSSLSPLPTRRTNRGRALAILHARAHTHTRKQQTHTHTPRGDPGARQTEACGALATLCRIPKDSSLSDPFASSPSPRPRARSPRPPPPPPPDAYLLGAARVRPDQWSPFPSLSA